WIAAADERVKCAVPVSGMSDLESYVKNKVINGHCDCMFLVNTYGWEWTTIAALVAPRPLLFANSDKDPIFPMDGNRRIIGRLRQLYKMYDKPEFVDEYVSMGGHDYRPDLRVAIFSWINKHIKNDTSSVKDADFEPLPGKELRVFAEDKDLPADSINGKVDETFVARAQVKLPEEGNFGEWKQGLMKELRAKSFRSFPDRIPTPESILTAHSGGAYDKNCASESGIGIRTFERFKENERKKQKEPWTLLVSELEGNPQDYPTWAIPFTKDFPTVQLTPRGVGVFEWSHKSPPNYVERSLALLGRTADHGRVWDIAANARQMGKKEEKPVRVVGKGQAGVLGAYAALFEPSIKEVVIVDPPTSHRDGPIFLNVLRVCDIPEALGML